MGLSQSNFIVGLLTLIAIGYGIYYLYRKYEKRTNGSEQMDGLLDEYDLSMCSGMSSSENVSPHDEPTEYAPYDKVTEGFTAAPTKKQKFKFSSRQKVQEQFDVSKLLPQEVNNEWFDTEPLLQTKKIKHSHLINPSANYGVNTISGSLRNATHDIRGDENIPKQDVGPWLQSTIEPDTNIRGFCN